MTGLYLTIDDSPSGKFPEMCAFLKERGIPAVFFVRGDLLSLYPERAVQAVKNGFVLANHSWSHAHTSRLGAELTLREIARTQVLIDQVYATAGVSRPGPYLRFPHMDSGLGGWPLPPEMFSAQESADVKRTYASFYNNAMAVPDKAQRKCHQDTEAVLQARDYRQMAFPGILVPWYGRYKASSAVSTQGTFCHPDWILAERHRGKVPEARRSVDALNMNFDAFMANNPGNHILVMHDHVELWPAFQALVDHMLSRGHRFLEIPA